MIPRAQHDRMANAIRALAMDAVETAKSGHPGLPMGAADVATVLFSRFLHFDPGDPAWPDRDRFVLSAGHGSMLIYAVLHLLGVEAITIEEIKRFRQLGSITPGHPEHGHTPGIETTTGPLGQGLANAVGMAIAVEARDLLIKRGCSAGWSRFPVSNCFWRHPRTCGNRSSGMRPCASRSRRRYVRDGTRSSAATAFSSAWRASGRVRPTRTSIAGSASPPRRR